MERTKKYSVVNDTLKTLKNQGLSERYFQKGHSFSSAPRYDHFDTSPFSVASLAKRHPRFLIISEEIEKENPKISNSLCSTLQIES